ncbi:NADH-quinone oxidoreductase subunit N [Sphingobacterium psychroaquaticum]|uniref:NADH-quinone oxidoreductase subunit N n=1 Tax=Sphingobacterium psychroaquaticum TaxID=561061 RepID=A0A1X7L249_9SPHI|nr:NADH-quinone oxidoreductase subunit N [Sphingobacterium psychroaquaticum]QBQ39862.1 NADH-quinone oxidoreductase subunit N [Sphingobacterium psychroaquaticum]SMG47765.1 NADH-quinone oxidoreductase subunit N [Sphingobacterium psychroaquaticum]
MGAIITLSVLGILVLYLGLYKAKNALLPVTLLGLLVAFGFTVADWNKDATPLFNGMVYFDKFALAFSMLCIFITALILLLSKEYFRNISEHVAEYYCLLVFSLTGALIVTAYHNFAMLFIGIEIMSVALYILVGIRKYDKASNEAALKYFLMGAFSTGFLLFGIALLYGASGTFDLEGLRNYVLTAGEISPLFYAGVLLMLCGLCFKIGAAPFHFWTPDVYDGAPILITAFMSTVVKVASFVGFLRLFSMVFVPVSDLWTPVLLTVVIITLFIGNITALMQSSFKRMMAYSSISHAGYMLFALVSISVTSAASMFTYAFAYSLASVIAFAILILVKRETGSDQFESFNGLGKRKPGLALAMTVAMLSLAGIPLTAGFIGKFMMFNQVMGGYNIVLLLLAVVNAAIGVYYYLHVVVNMYFKDADGEMQIQIPTSYKVVLTLAVALTILIGVYPDCVIGLL